MPCSLVEKHGVGCWSKLLPEFQGRIGKQLRERWNHELRPDINKEGWTHDEENQLVEAHKSVGNSWAEIAKVSRPPTAAGRPPQLRCSTASAWCHDGQFHGHKR